LFLSSFGFLFLPSVYNSYEKILKVSLELLCVVFVVGIISLPVEVITMECYFIRLTSYRVFCLAIKYTTQLKLYNRWHR